MPTRLRSHFTRTTFAVTGLLGAFAVGVVASQVGPALAQPSAAQASRPAGPTVYTGKYTGSAVVLGPQSAPTTMARTRVLPAGTYLVTTTVGAVIASHDQIVCATWKTPDANTNDGVFGTAGNQGTAATYGTATMTDVITVNGKQRIFVVCNAFNYGDGTTGGGAVINAVPVSRHYLTTGR